MTQARSVTATFSLARIALDRDFNGDGKADILWRNTTSGTVAMWLMNGGSITSNLGIATVPTSWATQ